MGMSKENNICRVPFSCSNDIIICVLNDVADKIKEKDLCTRENVNDILLEYTLDIHDIVLDEIMDRIEHY